VESEGGVLCFCVIMVITSYDEGQYGEILRWSRRAIWIDGKPIFLVSGEFQYWRVPDHSRWRSILAQYRAAGMNCVRFYFHWGYHSPQEGTYIFEGNRDMDYLLTLCEELGLFVVAAPGPYICAETQGGGFPTWLVAKPEVRIRHLYFHAIKRWDEKFMQHCLEWWKRICEIIARHEIVADRRGCVIAFQVENELWQKFAFADEVGRLAQSARELGIRTPIYHNDEMAHGSWTSEASDKNQSFCGDLYGVDLYFTFPPRDGSQDQSAIVIAAFTCGGLSTCLECFGIGGTGVNGRDLPCLNSCYHKGEALHLKPEPLGWKPQNFSRSLDRYEKRMMQIGGTAASRPIFVAEAQVGWINQWARTRGYDDFYRFFGDHFCATLTTTLASQGVTAINFYIPYGGTSYGTSGDSEVYTSYDYSGFIREYGKLSKRGRRTRFLLLFCRSFATLGVAETEAVEPSRSTKSGKAYVECSIPDILIKTRISTGDSGFAYLRNFTGADAHFSLALDGAVVSGHLTNRDSVIVPFNIPLRNSKSTGFVMNICSPRVISRGTYLDCEIWICSMEEGRQRFILSPTLASSDPTWTVSVAWANFDGAGGILEAHPGDEGEVAPLLSAPLEELPRRPTPSGPSVSLSAFSRDNGIVGIAIEVSEPCVFTLYDSREGESAFVRVLCLSEADSETFTMELDSSTESYSKSTNHALWAAWGVDEIVLDRARKEIRVLRNPFPSMKPNTLWMLGSSSPTLKGHSLSEVPSRLKEILPGLHAISFENPNVEIESLSRVMRSKWEYQYLSWDMELAGIPWKAIDYRKERNPLDHHFTGGHILYRCKFVSSRNRMALVVNTRHVAAIFCNGRLVGSHICYSHGSVSAGAMHAFDIRWAGKKYYDLTSFLKRGGNDTEQELVILVFSFGLSRQPFLLNDVRNRRGLLSAKLRPRPKQAEWHIAGKAVSSLNNPFNTSGLPTEPTLEDPSRSHMNVSGWTVDDHVQLTYSPEKGNIVWYRSQFKANASSGKVYAPLRLSFRTADKVHAFGWVNGWMIASYISYVGPQEDFFIMPGILAQEPTHGDGGKEGEGMAMNDLVIVFYGSSNQVCSVQVSIDTWIIDNESGNCLTEQQGGKPFVRFNETISLSA